MKNERNAEIKNYICSTFIKEDEAFLAVESSSSKEDLPNIAVPEHVGKILYLFAKLQQPKRILEIGTLAGYSTLWLAKGAPEAKITTIEYQPKHAAIARENFKATNLGNNINLIEDNALEVLTRLKNENESAFDLIFLDANKEDYPAYLPLLLALSRTGTLILTDNLIPKALEINSPHPNDIVACKTYEYNALLASHPNLDTTVITTIVGNNGRVDAMGVSYVKFL